MKSHDEIVKKLMRRPGVRAEVELQERALATGKHSPSAASSRKYVKACGKRLVLEVA